MGLLDRIVTVAECKSCVFWQPMDGLPDTGECHRHAPAPLNKEQQLGRVFPCTAGNDKCGDWEVKP
jgi:hypothetical protein